MGLRLIGLLIAGAGLIPPGAAHAPFAKPAVAGLPNLVEVHAKVLSGGQPEGDRAFARLAALGVKTVVSVDGMRPDVESARRHGLRYVHLPHGYDGVPGDRAVELAKAVRDLPGRIYLHCHHGRHRSPAAAAVACVGAGLLDPSQSEEVLRVAGTGSQYLGLFESVSRAKKFDPVALDQLQADFRETVPLPPLAQAMVEMDGLAERIERQGWEPGTPSPERSSSHAAVLLLEQYRELLRDPAVRAKPAAFVRLLEEGETQLAALQRDVTLLPKPPGSRIAARWKDVQQNCTVCHARFRDRPKTEEPAQKPSVQSSH